MADPLRKERDELERAQAELRALQARLDDPEDARRVADEANVELARLDARAGQLTRELAPLRDELEQTRLVAMEAKRKIHETRLVGNWSLEGRLVGAVASIAVGVWLGAQLGHGLWRDIVTPWLPWVFGVPAAAMFARELHELGQKAGRSYRDD